MLCYLVICCCFILLFLPRLALFAILTEFAYMRSGRGFLRAVQVKMGLRVLTSVLSSFIYVLSKSWSDMEHIWYWDGLWIIFPSLISQSLTVPGAGKASFKEGPQPTSSLCLVQYRPTGKIGFLHLWPRWPSLSGKLRPVWGEALTSSSDKLGTQQCHPCARDLGLCALHLLCLCPVQSAQTMRSLLSSKQLV